MGVNIKPLSWGRRLAREAIRKGKKFSRVSPRTEASLAKTGMRSLRKKYSDMAREFRKKG